ncbi:hypothetical protein C490_01210 [Natronobacterium gregoryi SP2]|uniref:PQQ-binding-like beta-propeller repeat protein n=1 Tax=Natronobacterium gregoryi (strain ATCC 43098 / DSM 3393 / CCM 3738 / CIP 104747 / IAM 13177 / JCM 8860 / NBRC 102187 / NCIMB 2189 / SP2) TaxID=797304 RepID=L9YID6_NATGS|nr:hypothetical protein C490_01210 [Natronobacterium gregoryi SP2]
MLTVGSPPESSRSALPAQSPSVTWSRTYDPGGEIAAASSLGSRGAISDLQPTEDGLLMVGHVFSDGTGRGWIASVDDSGRQQWERVFDGSTEFQALEPVAPADGDGRTEQRDTLVCGTTNAAVRPESGARNFDPYCGRLDDDGSLTWGLTYQTERSYGGSYGSGEGDLGGSGRLFDLTAAGDRYVAAGRISERRRTPSAICIDGRGDLEWRWEHPGDVRGTAWGITAVDDEVVLVGAHGEGGRDAETAWLARIDGRGETVWETALWDAEDGSRLTTVARGPRDTVLVAGTRASDEAGVLAVDGTDGAVRWRDTAADGVDELEDAFALEDGYLLVGSRATDDGTAAWVALLESGGDVVWATTVSERRHTTGHAVRPTPDGGVLVGGETRDDDAHAWLAKLGGDDGGSGWELPTPSLPAWTGPFAVGAGVGGGIAGLLAYRRTGATMSDATDRE